jgi:hypothetical protein
MLDDLRCCLRSLRRQPGFALAAIATLAVGIGATTAITEGFFDLFGVPMRRSRLFLRNPSRQAS